MSQTSRNRNTTRARQIACEAADEYITALAAENPSDTALIEANLLFAVVRIHDALIEEDERRGLHDRDDAARHAGYILALEIGKRLAGRA
jgi:hypothetical protein